MSREGEIEGAVLGALKQAPRGISLVMSTFEAGAGGLKVTGHSESVGLDQMAGQTEHPTATSPSLHTTATSAGLLTKTGLQLK